MNKSADIKLRILSGSAMHSSIRHSKKGTEMREIYNVIRRDPSTLVDSYANWRDLVLEGYAVIRPLEDAYLLMQKHPCKIHAPRGIFHACTSVLISNMKSTNSNYFSQAYAGHCSPHSFSPWALLTRKCFETQS